MFQVPYYPATIPEPDFGRDLLYVKARPELSGFEDHQVAHVTSAELEIRGEKIQIAASRVPSFSAGNALKEAI
jgi:hypothetical protein